VSESLSTQRRPKVGVGVFVQRGDEVLLGLRKGSHGAETWSIPGGLIEADERVFEAAIRELYEETGISVPGVATLVAPASLRGFEKPGGFQEYVTLYAHTVIPKSWEAKILEPEKCAEWRWITMCRPQEKWPGPLFECLEDLLGAVKVASPYQLGHWLGK